MAKSLNDILQRYKDVISGKLPPSKIETLTTGENPGVDYADKMKDGRDFVGMHTVEKHPDRNGNGDDVFKGSTTKAKMERHGHEPKPKDIKVYNKTQQVSEAKDNREYDYEGEMAVTKLKTIVRASEHLIKMMKPNTNLPEWVQSKIVKAEDYLTTAHDYLMSEMNEEVEELDEAKCNMTEAGKMCEVHGMKACPKEGAESASDKEPRYTGKKKSGRQLITDKKLQEMATSQNQAIAARIALKHKREGTMPPKGTASHSMMGMSEKQLHDYTKAEKGAPKKVEESISNQRTGRATASEKAREKIANSLERVKMEKMKHKLKMKEQAAPAETVIRMPSGEVGDTGRV